MNTAAKSDIMFLLRFMPDWTKEVPEGLDPTMYGTLSYEGDVLVKRHINDIKERWGIDDAVS